jgi:hypothetical protein
MLVKTEKTKDSNFVLVVDENDVYKGTIHLGTFFKFCVLEEGTTCFDEYDYYTVDKSMIEKYCSLK